MAAVSSASIIPAHWSNCSQAYINDWFDTPSDSHYGGTNRASCLENVPTVSWTNVSTCGNGIRETGEACDCGIQDCSVVDPCCNGATCQLVGGAACSSLLDSCCDSCQIVTDVRNLNVALIVTNALRKIESSMSSS